LRIAAPRIKLHDMPDDQPPFLDAFRKALEAQAPYLSTRMALA